MAHHIAAGLVADEFDMAYFQHKALDHGCFSPLSMLWPHEPDWPGAIIPLQVLVDPDQSSSCPLSSAICSVPFFYRPTAGNLARAESAKVPSADSKHDNVENARFPFLSETEQPVR